MSDIVRSDLRQDAGGDRIVILSAGKYVLYPTLIVGEGGVFRWAQEKLEEARSAFEAKPGDNKWKLMLPEEFWSEARD